MNLKQLRYFIQTYEDGSFSKAAKNLFITPQGLSKSIKNLEVELKAPLFERATNGIKPTEYGRYLYVHSKPLFDQLIKVLDNFEIMVNNHDKKIYVGFTSGIVNALSSDLISSFKKNYPDTELSIIEDGDLILEKAIENEEIDLAFTIGPIDTEKFNCHMIKKEKLCVLVNELHPLSHKTSISFSDLKGENISIINQNFKVYHNFISKCKLQGFTPQISFPAADILTVHKLSNLNNCVGISAFFLLSAINYPSVKAIPFEDDSFTWDICLVTKKNHYMSNHVREFIKHVKINS